jgi:hypothetical protein
MIQEEIYKTKRASVSQCDSTESFYLTFDEQVIEFKLCDLVTFRNKIKQIDIVELLDCNSPDIEVIHLPHCDRFLVLSVQEILQFRELLNGTFDILALNSAISRILRKHMFNF